MYKHCLLPILPLLPLLSCALPLPAEWHGNSSHIHALLLAISIGTVLLPCLRTKAGMQGILEGVRWYPSVEILPEEDFIHLQVALDRQILPSELTIQKDGQVLFLGSLSTVDTDIFLSRLYMLLNKKS